MRSPLRRAVPCAMLLASGVHGVSAAQECADWSRSRAYGVGGVYVAGAGISLAVRAHDWWRNESTGGFRVAWDGTPALGQDYLLRAYVSYQLSQIGGFGFRWACVPPKTAAWLGAGFAAVVWLPKEIGDGFHDDGFSIVDLVSSTAGALLPALHYEFPESKAIQYKFNYWPSPELRNRQGPDPQLESDYAGMRFFLAYNPALVETAPDWWPDWLGVALGHSTLQWVSAPPEHQWYFTLDLNARGLPIEASWWPTVAAFVDQVKLPLPGLRFQGGGISFGLF